MYYIGYDIGSSSVKVALVDEKTKKSIAVVSEPKNEMVIKAGKFNWAEQDPNIGGIVFARQQNESYMKIKFRQRIFLRSVFHIKCMDWL